MAGVIPVDYEGQSQTCRFTKGGKELKYMLKVLQQPERARACGAGAKSSADRRPVDPPPVVELRIYEDGRDITFQYNANFFLFATLEAARTLAAPRGQPVTPPVLTGVPVAGMAYLDRPEQAGYFIFPDLSVRHEGNYRLSFNLFEEIKDAKDDDANASIPHPTEQPLIPQSADMSGPKPYMHFRLLVRSNPFQVYSAKKFPGLAESTQLSRCVAEQGCRVRIRRDVRMRRRDTHGKDEYPFEEDEGGYSRADRIATPDNYPQHPMPERARSSSRGSMDPSHGYPIETSRRTSMTDASPYHPNYPTPQTAAPPLMNSFPGLSQGHSHLSFGGSSDSQNGMIRPPQGPTPVTTSISQTNGYPYQRSPLVRQHSNSNPHLYHYPSSQQQIFHPQSRPETPAYNAKSEYPQTLTRGFEHFAYPENGSGFKQGTPVHAATQLAKMQQPMTPGRSQPELPPISAFPSLQEGAMTNHTEFKRFPAPESLEPKQDTFPREYYDPVPRQPKRAYGSAFSLNDLVRPLHGGMRPDNYANTQKFDPDGSVGSGDSYEDGSLMLYRRADGQPASKPMPRASQHLPSSLFIEADYTTR